MINLKTSAVDLYQRAPAEVRGAALVLLSTFAFSAMHASIRQVSSGIHPFEVAFFRNVFGLVALAPFFFRHGLKPFRTNRLSLHFTRGLIQSVAMLAFFMALSLTPLAQVIALNFVAPLFASLGMVLFLGESMRLRRWIALFVGFLGALVIIRPGYIPLELGPVLVIAASALWAGALVIIKSLSRTESSLTLTVYMGIFLVPPTFLAALFYWTWPTPEQFAWLLWIGVVGTIGHLSMAQAFREADATAVLPFDFTRLIWASIIAYFAFGEIPDLWTWAGGFTIFAAVTYMAMRESKRPPNPD
jgi:drug/metabolite transporter (DMT)-like permease